MSNSQQSQPVPFKRLLKILINPWAIVVSLILGVFIGAKLPNVAEFIAPVGQLYVALFKMCVLPILLSGITMSIGRLMTRPDASEYIKRILVFFPITLIATSAIAMLIGLVAQPGKLTPETLDALGGVIQQSGIDLEVSLTGPLVVETEENGLVTFVLNVIPDNIFDALSTGQTLQILFFIILFGLGLGYVPRQASENLFIILEGVYGSFNKLIDWLRYLLPFGLCSLLAEQISQVGAETLLAMLRFVLITVIMFAVFYIINTVIIAWRSKQSLLKVFSGLQETTIISLATRSSLASMPAAITEMEHLKFEPQTTNLVVPLSITLCRFGSVAYFALGALFVVQVYQNPINLGTLTVILVGAILAGMATSGVSGILTLTMMSLVLDPLSLPLDAVLVLFIAIDPIVDPFRTLIIVHSGAAVTALIAEVVEEEPDTTACSVSVEASTAT